jgi:protein-S-isoprenylcysteine O-methyltransferase Ste14
VGSAIVFVVGTAFFAWVSRRSLLKPRSHGFYRFFAWECILALALVNFPLWEADPLAPHQIASWSLLLISPVLAMHSVRLLRRLGNPGAQRTDAELLSFERTSRLVTTGAYHYIRHPMYAALLLLAWGVFLKDTSSVASMALAAGASVMLVLTALRDEAECRRYFGVAYAEYMNKTSRRFIPFLL